MKYPIVTLCIGPGTSIKQLPLPKKNGEVGEAQCFHVSNMILPDWLICVSAICVMLTLYIKFYE